MKRIILIVCFLPNIVFCQIVDEFNAIKFNEDQQWHGDTNFFKTEEGHLISNFSTEKNSSFLYHKLNDLKNPLLYDFHLEMAFSPSSSNALQILLAGELEKQNIINGIALQIGETGSNDGLNVIKYKDGIKSKVTTFSEGQFSNSPSKRLLITYNGVSSWQIKEKTDQGEIVIGSFDYLPEFVSGISGLFFNYTSTRVDKFRFDYWRVKKISEEESGPVMIDHIATKDGITLYFSKKIKCDDIETELLINGVSAESNYSCNDSILEVTSLAWEQKFKNYELKISNISDFNGNSTGLIRISGSHVSDNRNTLLITEVLPDPDRNSNYTEEFIEIYNSGDQNISLGEFSICDLSKCINLPDIVIGTNEVIVFTGKEGVYPESIIITGLPSLNNTGDQVFLKYGENTVDSFSYSDNTFRSLDLTSSGTSLKRRFQNFICDGDLNISGGDPGPGNVKLESGPEKLADLKITFSDYNKILKVKSDALTDISNLKISIENQNTQFQITDEIRLGNYKINHFKIEDHLNHNQQYKIKLSGQKNCITGKIDSVLFESINTMDDPEKECLKVSEFMFDPETGKGDFIEIYNECGGIIEISKYKFIFMDHNQIVDDTINIEEKFDEYHLAGKSVGLIYSEDSDFEENYFVEGSPLLIELKNFINLRNSGGYFEIFREIPGEEFKKEIERSGYFEGWHSYWMDDTEGVSLERFNFEGDPAFESVWKSASELNNYSTPGIISGSGEMAYNEEISFQPKVIIPGDPYYGEQMIHLKTDNSGRIVTVELFSLSGKLIKTFCLDCYVSDSLTLRWEGIQDSGQVIKPGHYILRVTYIDSNGNDDLIIRPLAVGL
ncbi:lamin tail domain-containing protein [Mangrovivirga cuniculi]|uniref:LTD domain-containing protein n=1 Tax=Mangrovivirga cuniculi TaxID=2715131 RepID=A0A4D7JBT6_9BACT|nr:lamin tail domain-containing protein [Mangrovivirga cuniculi]QCK13839.1 hypothetical protein DCC35_03220 [Mangrovivirga cuniculi]